MTSSRSHRIALIAGDGIGQEVIPAGVATIEAALRSSARSSGLHIVMNIDPVDQLFPPTAEINLFRIIQEGLTNVLKHSNASECTVTVHREGSWCEVRIADDGCGLSAVNPATAPRGGFGMVNMAERCRLLGGQMEVHSAPGEGTTLVFSIPIPGDRKEHAHETPDTHS